MSYKSPNLPTPFWKTGNPRLRRAFLLTGCVEQLTQYRPYCQCLNNLNLLFPNGINPNSGGFPFGQGINPWDSSQLGIGPPLNSGHVVQNVGLNLNIWNAPSISTLMWSQSLLKYSLAFGFPTRIPYVHPCHALTIICSVYFLYMLVSHK